MSSVRLLLLISTLLVGGAALGAPPYGLANRAAFTAYNQGKLIETAPVVSGTWSTVVAYPHLVFQDLLGVLPMLGTNKLVAWEREGRVYSFDDNDATTTKTLILDLSDRCQGWDDMGLLGLAFHPNFANNHYVYLWYNWVPPGTVTGDANTRPDGRISTHQRLARFTYNPTSGLLDPASEFIVIDQIDHNTWHNGGGLFFGPTDGYLYLTNGDDYDPGNDQNISRGLFGCLLRIDVDKRGGEFSQKPTRRAVEEVGPNWPEAYYVPKDNPFVNNGDVLTEIFALGLRSPDHATVDPISGRIFISDVGESTNEEVDLIEPTDPPGLNFQWNVFEGFQGDLTAPYLGVNKRPVISYDHGQGNAVIGGYVYRGSQFPDLYGKYVFGDNGFGTIWCMDETTATGLAPAGKIALAQLPDGQGPKSGSNYLGLSAFGYDTQNELLMCQMGSISGQLYRLARTGAPPVQMPLTLSGTGVFSDLATLTPVTGFVAYDVNTALWSDGAHKSRWFAVPDGETVSYASSGEWAFPNGSVFVKHFELPIDDTDPTRLKRLETRVLVRDSTGYVYGGSYKWRADNSDADLVINATTENVTIAAAGGDLRTQPWFYPGRQDCLSCHTRATGGVLGLNTPQSNRAHLFTETTASDNQLRAWNHVGYFSPAVSEATIPSLQKLSAIDDTTVSIELRARSYLDANCAHCHRPGGVPAFWDARIETPLASAGIVNGLVSDALGVGGARVIVPQNLAHSVLYKRLGTATASYKMPPIAKNVIDDAAVSLVAQWIGEVQAPPVAPLPTPWLQADLGDAVGGATSSSANAFMLHSTGADIGGVADAFHYVYRDLKGDGMIAARVAAESFSDAAAKAGVMIRETLSADSAHASTVLLPGGNAAFQRRATLGADTTSTQVTASVPSWLAIRRSGNEFISARSADGVTWQEIGRQTIPMAATVKVGLCVTAHSAASECAVAFESVSFQPGVSFIVTGQPRSQLVHLGAAATFNVGVFGDTPTAFQWRRNGVAITNAKSASYTIPLVSASQAGSYSVLLNDKVASAAGALSVVGEAVYNPNIPLGATATLTVPAIGTGLAFHWSKGGVPLPAATGSKAVLSVPHFTALLAGDYSCTVTAGADSLVLGPYSLHLLGKPALTAATPDATFIGDAFHWQLSASEPTTTYTVSGLPTGLTFDAKTALISGQPRVNGNFTITVTPHNAAGTGPAQKFTLQIGALPAGLAGGYGGLIDPSAAVNNGLGGRFSFNVTGTGMVTGKLFHAGAASALTLTGQVLALAAGDASVTFTVKRGKLPPLTLTAQIAAGGASLSGGLMLNGLTTTLQGRHDLAAASAAALAASYNGVLRPPSGGPPLPEGAGRIRVVITANGAATVTGGLPDGITFSFGTNLNNQSMLPLYAGVYSSLGSASGLALVAPTAGLREITSTLDWRKLTTPASRTYPGAFTTTTALLAREYQAPTGTAVYLGLPSAAGNAVIEFTGATLNAAAQAAHTQQTFRLSSNKAIFATDTTNPCHVAMTVTPSTGLFLGTFTLHDGALPRTAPFAGFFVPGEPFALGFFRLPRLPAKPQPANVPLTTPIDAGLVEVRAAGP